MMSRQLIATLLIAAACLSLAAAPPVPSRPYTSIADVPPGAFFRLKVRIVKDLHDKDAVPWHCYDWSLATGVSDGKILPPAVRIDGALWSPAEISAKLEYTMNPYATPPVVRPCLK